MGIFMLDCDTVTSVGSTIDSLASKVSDISSSVSSYDTSCEDGFDFNSAKSVIASNIEACSIKIQNTSSLINNVVESHTSLQNSFVLGGDSSGTSSTANNSRGGSSSSSPSPSYRNSVSTGGYTGGYSGGAVPYVHVSQTAKFKKSNKKGKKLSVEVEYDDKKFENEIKADFVDTDEKMMYIEDTSSFGDFGEILNDNNFNYSLNGYGMIGNRYVIACDKSIGKVGDSITITRPDGTHIDCIIGDVTENMNNKNAINFFVNDSTLNGQVASAVPSMLLDTNISVVNNGQVELGNLVNSSTNSTGNGVVSALPGVETSIEKLSEEQIENINSNSDSKSNSQNLSDMGSEV